MIIRGKLHAILWLHDTKIRRSSLCMFISTKQIVMLVNIKISCMQGHDQIDYREENVLYVSIFWSEGRNGCKINFINWWLGNFITWVGALSKTNSTAADLKDLTDLKERQLLCAYRLSIESRRFHIESSRSTSSFGDSTSNDWLQYWTWKRKVMYSR